MRSRAACPRGIWSGASGASSRRLEPDLAQRDVRVAESVHLDAPDVRLEEPLVGVMHHRDDRRVVEHELLGTLVELDSPLEVRRVPRGHEQLVDRGIRVMEEIAGALRVEELEKEV